MSSTGAHDCRAGKSHQALPDQSCMHRLLQPRGSPNTRRCPSGLMIMLGKRKPPSESHYSERPP